MALVGPRRDGGQVARGDGLALRIGSAGASA
jgi:hypothetical protein